MLCNCCCACVFPVFMVSSLVATSRNSLCVFVTLSCDGSPRAVATVVGCLCELFSKWKPVTLLRECDVSASICLQWWPHYGHDAEMLKPFWGKRAHGKAGLMIPMCWTWKRMFILRNPQRYWAQRNIKIPQGLHKHPPLLRAKRLAASNGYHSNWLHTSCS